MSVEAAAVNGFKLRLRSTVRPFHVGLRAVALSVICSSQIHTFGGLDVPLKHSKQQIQIM